MPASHETVDGRMHFMKMEGSTLFRIAVNAMSDSVKMVLERNRISPEDINSFYSGIRQI